MRITLNSIGTAFIAGSIIDYADKIPFIHLWPHLAFLGLVVIIGVEIWQKFGKKASATSNELEDSPLEKIYTRWTAAEIFADIQNGTILQAEGKIKLHIGKWLRVHDVVSNVSANENYIYVYLGRKFQPVVCLSFDRKQWEPKIETIRKGESLTAEGRITGIELVAMYLDNCTIVEDGDK